MRDQSLTNCHKVCLTILINQFLVFEDTIFEIQEFECKTQVWFVKVQTIALECRLILIFNLYLRVIGLLWNKHGKRDIETMKSTIEI